MGGTWVSAADAVLGALVRRMDELLRTESLAGYAKQILRPAKEDSGLLAPPDLTGSCACVLATSLDIQWLQDRRAGERHQIWPRATRLEEMPTRPGPDVARELGGRVLLRYVTEQHAPPTDRMVWTTVTPLCPRCSGPILHLPQQVVARHWVFAIDPASVAEILGPRECIMGQGIEYILPRGYDQAALVPPGYGVRVR